MIIIEWYRTEKSVILERMIELKCWMESRAQNTRFYVPVQIHTTAVGHKKAKQTGTVTTKNVSGYN